MSLSLECLTCSLGNAGECDDFAGVSIIGDATPVTQAAQAARVVVGAKVADNRSDECVEFAHA